MKLDTLSKFDRFLLSYARAVDDIDMFTAPVSTLAIWHSDDKCKKLGFGLAAAEFAVKTPFIALYAARTRDYKSIVEWIGWEFLAHAIPYEGGILSIRRNYEKNTTEYFKNNNLIRKK